MTEPREKRRDPRVPLVLRVDYPGTPNLRDATENLSAGGLLIRTDRPLAVGDRVPLQIGFPGLLEPFEVEVEVVRLRPPRETSPAAAAVKIPVDRVDDRHKLAGLAETARAAQAAARARRGFRVLVVEDNPHVVEMYEYALKKLKQGGQAVEVTVEYAAHGHEALRRLAEAPAVDLVMADLYMPVMDGFVLVEKMKAEPALARIPILVISAGGQEARARAAELGADVCLAKPVQFGDIIQTVRTLLRLQG
jgi:uncharacterized protein (TIGR02266 family)